MRPASVSTCVKVRMSKLHYILMLQWALVTLVGCGQGLPIAPASGVVLLDGAPLANVNIMTQPIATNSPNPGPGSFGRTDAEGRFDLELVKPPIGGAIIGEHRVMIMTVGGAKPAGGEKWPTRFSDGSLRIQVPKQGTKDIRVDLTRKMNGTK
jgi:hypothetical protein